MIQLRPRSALGGGDFGWLKAKHHFAFGSSGNPAHQPLGSLIVWNDDEIAPGEGFPSHRHQDMEIVTYVRQGVVAHSDSVGGSGRIEAGNVQVISAGTGIRHAEYNGSEIPLKLFQIWMLPRLRGAQPRWDTRPFPKADRAGKLVALASGLSGDEEALPIRADARLMGALLKTGARVHYMLAPGRQAYLVPARGSVVVNGERLATGDGIAIREESAVVIEALEDAEIVLVDAG